MKRTLYQILGVETDATAEAITAAYRAKLGALQIAPGSDAAALTLLREAYQVLSGAPQRAAYEASLAAPVPSGVARPRGPGRRRGIGRRLDEMGDRRQHRADRARPLVVEGAPRAEAGG